MLEQLQLVVKVVDGAHSLPFSEFSPSAGRQDCYPQQPHEDQQDHNRQLPDDLPSVCSKSLLNGFLQMVDGGEMHSADLVGTSPRVFVCTNVAARFQALFFRPAQPCRRLLKVARLHHRPSSQPTFTSTPKQADTFSDVMTSRTAPAAIRVPPRINPP
jgi:hypothetical protein